jgi:predicted HAD superfamily Cof-like phosphohydrolase
MACYALAIVDAIYMAKNVMFGFTFIKNSHHHLQSPLLPQVHSEIILFFTIKAFIYFWLCDECIFHVVQKARVFQAFFDSHVFFVSKHTKMIFPPKY